MKKCILFGISFFLIQHIEAQCPTLPLELTTQAQVNAFPADFIGCIVIPEGIEVKIMGNDIIDLSPLAQITGSLGAFEIRDCPLLQDLDGLQNVTFFGNDALDGFILRDLPLLNDISALAILDSITGEFTIRDCEDLTSLSGLDGLQKVNGSIILRTIGVQNFNGLQNLTYVGETLEIVENASLNDISALSNVNTIVGGLEGGVFIVDNPVLSNLTGLGNNTTTIGSNLDLVNNGDLSVCSVPSICNYLSNPPLGAVITINTNLLGCNSQSEILANCVGVSVYEYNEMDVVISPNPANTIFGIQAVNSTITKVEIRNIFGDLMSVSMEKNIFSFDISHLSAGTYFVNIHSTEGNISVKKLIKL